MQLALPTFVLAPYCAASRSRGRWVVAHCQILEAYFREGPGRLVRLSCVAAEFHLFFAVGMFVGHSGARAATAGFVEYVLFDRDMPFPVGGEGALLVPRLVDAVRVDGDSMPEIFLSHQMGRLSCYSEVELADHLVGSHPDAQAIELRRLQWKLLEEANEEQRRGVRSAAVATPPSATLITSGFVNNAPQSGWLFFSTKSAVAASVSLRLHCPSLYIIVHYCPSLSFITISVNL